MQALTFNPFVIISAECSKLSAAENDGRSAVLQGYLKTRSVPFKVLLGCYEGKNETSLLIGFAHYEIAEQQALKWEQESILYVDGCRNAELRFLDGRASVKLGRFERVTSSEAKTLNAWTLDPVSLQYYSCK